jgi:hypothetical protein
VKRHNAQQNRNYHATTPRSKRCATQTARRATHATPHRAARSLGGAAEPSGHSKRTKTADGIVLNRSKMDFSEETPEEKKLRPGGILSLAGKITGALAPVVPALAPVAGVIGGVQQIAGALAMSKRHSFPFSFSSLNMSFWRRACSVMAICILTSLPNRVASSGSYSSAIPTIAATTAAPTTAAPSVTAPSTTAPSTSAPSTTAAPQSPPITAGLIAHYNADSWTSSRWTDLSGAGNHVTEVGGSISVARPVGAPAYIYGDETASMKFPEGILPSAQYTLFFVARFNGLTRISGRPIRGRIFQGVNINWLSGFGGHNLGDTAEPAGVAFHGDCGWITPYTQDIHVFDWVVGTDRSNSFRSNGVLRSNQPLGNCAVFDRICINTGKDPNVGSPFAIQSVLVYNVKLSDADVLRVEAWLNTFQPAFTPANLQASVCVHSQTSSRDIHLYKLKT